MPPGKGVSCSGTATSSATCPRPKCARSPRFVSICLAPEFVNNSPRRSDRLAEAVRDSQGLIQVCFGANFCFIEQHVPDRIMNDAILQFDVSGMRDTVAVHSFDRLLVNGASVSQIDDFLQTLSSKNDPSMSAKVLVHCFSSKGYLRDQIPYLLDLYKNGCFTDDRPESRVTFIFFNGIFAPIHFAMVRARLCAINASCIYLYDDRIINYGLGIRQLGADLRGSDDALRTILRQFRAERIITFGYSAGAFAAIRCALSLNAYGTVGFSPFTTFLDRDYRDDGRGRSLFDRVKQIAPETLFDLLPLLKQKEPPLKIISFFSGSMAKDVWQSRRLNILKDAYTIERKGDASLASHNVLSELIANGTFDRLFRRLSQGGSAEDSLKFALTSKRVAEGRKRLLETAAAIPTTTA
jgi:hypothetical protein